MRKLIFKKGSIYWMNGKKINNYLSKNLAKKRPFICIDKKKINNNILYYFISGTSRSKKDIKAKQFINYFLKIKKSSSNKLSYDTLFQMNCIYVISEKNISKLILDKKKYYLGDLKNSEKKKMNTIFFDVNDEKIYSLTYIDFDNLKNNSYLIHYQKKFLYTATRHKKYTKDFEKIITENKKIGDLFIKKDKYLSKEMYDFERLHF
ncbi:MAG: hypothetical protein ACRC8C_02880 [Mycoplasmoidaceae bacterium]